jgi:hypothetical protein
LVSNLLEKVVEFRKLGNDVVTDQNYADESSIHPSQKV